MGVGYEEFWDLSPRTLKPFAKAFKLRSEISSRDRWEQGFYISLAVMSVLDGKNSPYPDKPLTGSSPQNEEAKAELMQARFLAQATRLNARFKE